MIKMVNMSRELLGWLRSLLKQTQIHYMITWPVKVWIFVTHMKRSKTLALLQLIHLANLDDKWEPS